MPETVFDLTGKRVWVAGHRGMVGSALVRRLADEPIGELITARSTELDLRLQEPTHRFVAERAPDVVFLAAAKVGGILANRDAQGEFLYDNLMIAANVIEAARLGGVAKTVVLGSSCIYPRVTSQPIPEEALLTGPLEPSNEGYAIAKIAALELGRMYRRQYGTDVVSLMPPNLYGPNDHYDLRTAHVLPALLRKIHEAKVEGRETVEIWGTGTARREFLHVDDLADATVFALRHYSGESHLNAGTGIEVSIADLATVIAGVVGWDGEFTFDRSKPDGTPVKCLDVSRIHALGWRHRIDLVEGIEAVYRDYAAAATA